LPQIIETNALILKYFALVAEWALSETLIFM